MKYRMQLPACG